MQMKPPKFSHIRLDSGRAVTLAYQFSEDGKVAKVGYSVCSPKDQFKKKEGRTRALTRLESEGALVIPLKAEKPSSTWYSRMSDILSYMETSLHVDPALRTFMEEADYLKLLYNVRHYQKVFNAQPQGEQYEDENRIGQLGRRSASGATD